MTGLEITNTIIDAGGLAVIVFVLYVLMYYIKKYNLEKWVVKAVNAAEIMFDLPNSSEEKKKWVINFLEENGLTKGVPASVVDALIEAAVNALNIQQGKIE